MSLQVWLPLDGDLHNQGASNYTISTFRGTETYDNNGKIGKCFYAHGTNTLKILNILPDIYNYSSYSLCAWCYIEEQNTSHSGSGIISGGNWNNQVLNLAMSDWLSDHYTKLRISGSNWNRTYNYNFYKNTWYHIVVCDDGTQTYGYVNGVLIGNTAASFLPTSIEGTDICIGGATYYSGMQFFGKINDVRIYDHCLSAAEVHEISQGLVLHYKLNDLTNGVLDSSGYGHHGLVTGNLSSSDNSARYNNCIYMPNGQTDYITSQDNVGYFTNGITLNIWFKSANKSPGSSYHHCFNSLTSWTYIEMAVHSGGFLRCGLYINGTRYVANTDNTNLLDGNWHMLTMTYDGANVKRYVDGVLKSTQAATGNLNTTSDKFIFGHGASTGYYCKEAYLSDARLYVTGLSADDILQLYHTSAKVDNKQNLHTFELVENNSAIKINKRGQTLCNELGENAATKFYKTNQIIETNEIIEF